MVYQIFRSYFETWETKRRGWRCRGLVFYIGQGTKYLVNISDVYKLYQSVNQLICLLKLMFSRVELFEFSSNFARENAYLNVLYIIWTDIMNMWTLKALTFIYVRSIKIFPKSILQTNYPGYDNFLLSVSFNSYRNKRFNKFWLNHIKLLCIMASLSSASSFSHQKCEKMRRPESHIIYQNYPLLC